MPDWLQVVAKLNPLSYMVDGLRSLLVTGGTAYLALDFGVLIVSVGIISLVSAYLYPKVVV